MDNGRLLLLNVLGDVRLVVLGYLQAPDLSGLGRAGWACFVFLLPLIGVLIYIATKPRYMEYDPAVPWAPSSSANMSPAEEVAYAKQLLDQGTLTQAEFEEVKWNALH